MDRHKMVPFRCPRPLFLQSQACDPPVPSTLSTAELGRTKALAFLTREHRGSQSVNISSIGGKLNLNNSQGDLLSSWAASGKLCSLAPLCTAGIHLVSHTSPEARGTGQLMLITMAQSRQSLSPLLTSNCGPWGQVGKAMQGRGGWAE